LSHLTNLRELVERLNVVLLVEQVRDVENFARNFRSKPPNELAKPIDDETRSRARDALLALGKMLPTPEYKLTVLKVSRMCSDIEKTTYSVQQIGDDFTDLAARIFDEISSFSCYLLASWAPPYIEAPTATWSDTLGSFPSSLFDIEEAGKCLAFERYTSTVFHCMRIVELGLVPLADEFSVSSDKANWHIIISQIESEIANRSKSQGANWTDQQFYTEAALSFHFFKDAWRNHVMHVRLTFDEERAKRIYSHVQSFMNQIATKLSEKVQP